MKNFALIGAAGYIAPRHLNAIKDTGNNLVAVTDPHDAVGIMDSYFPDALYFPSQERFERYINKLKNENDANAIDIVSICSPNHLHESHIRLAFWSGADAICEKPLVINPWNLDTLTGLEEETGKRVSTVLQLRLQPDIVQFKEQFEKEKHNEKIDVNLTYITRRGNWYHYSWKGDEEQSGSLMMNIGVHFFDLLVWLFGDVERYELNHFDANKAAGVLELKKARVRWFLSIDYDDLPKEHKAEGRYAYRSFTFNGDEIELSKGFTDLHTRVYESILAGKGFGIEDARPSIELVHRLRGCKITQPGEFSHAYLKKVNR